MSKELRGIINWSHRDHIAKMNDTANHTPAAPTMTVEEGLAVADRAMAAHAEWSRLRTINPMVAAQFRLRNSEAITLASRALERTRNAPPPDDSGTTGEK